MTNYERPVLEDFIEDTIPPINYYLTEFFFAEVTRITLSKIEERHGKVVLDVAAGMGIDSRILASRGFNVIAMEPMKRMIGFSVKHHRENGAFSNHLLGYAEEIPLRTGSVDQVLCKGSLDHFIDPEASLKEMRRVLKPGGIIVAAIANYDSLSCRISKLIWDFQHRGGKTFPNEPRPHHEIPSDHKTRFNAVKLREMIGGHFVVEEECGIGAFWGTPYVNLLVEKAPRKLAEILLSTVYAIVRGLPSLADMSLVVGSNPA